jgi:hypothetical protein
MKKRFLICIFLCGTALFLAAQPTRIRAIWKEKKGDTGRVGKCRIYNNVKDQTKQSLSQLNMLKRKMNLQERYINEYK